MKPPLAWAAESMGFPEAVPRIPAAEAVVQSPQQEVAGDEGPDPSVMAVSERARLPMLAEPDVAPGLPATASQVHRQNGTDGPASQPVRRLRSQMWRRGLQALAETASVPLALESREMGGSCPRLEAAVAVETARPAVLGPVQARRAQLR